MANVNGSSTRSKRQKARVSGEGKTTLRLTDQDRAHAESIRRSGWASNTTGAIRFALKFTAEKVAA